jgi:hypothetical protein
MPFAAFQQPYGVRDITVSRYAPDGPSQLTQRQNGPADPADPAGLAEAAEAARPDQPCDAAPAPAAAADQVTRVLPLQQAPLAATSAAV